MSLYVRIHSPTDESMRCEVEILEPASGVVLYRGQLNEDWMHNLKRPRWILWASMEPEPGMATFDNPG